MQGVGTGEDGPLREHSSIRRRRPDRGSPGYPPRSAHLLETNTDPTRHRSDASCALHPPNRRPSPDTDPRRLVTQRVNGPQPTRDMLQRHAADERLTAPGSAVPVTTGNRGVMIGACPKGCGENNPLRWMPTPGCPRVTPVSRLTRMIGHGPIGAARTHGLWRPGRSRPSACSLIGRAAVDGLWSRLLEAAPIANFRARACGTTG